MINSRFWKFSLLVCCLVGSELFASDPGPSAGFRSLSWGSQPKGMVSIPIDQGGKAPMELYWDPGDFGSNANTMVAGFRTETISYYFFRNRFCRVEIDWQHINRKHVDEIGTTLSVAWGKADVTDSIGRRIWNSKDRETMAALTHSADSGIAELTIVHVPCQREAAAVAAGLKK